MNAQPQEKRNPRPQPARPPQPTPLLDELTVDLTARARAGRLAPVIGREREIEELVAILGKSRKNNAVLVGGPGVGKSAIPELLAQRVAAGEVPPFLANARLRQLDVSALTAGAGVRGTFEERLRRLLAEIAGSASTEIVVIDEVHTLLGAGGPEGGLDAANLVKPALARGDLRCIGATTD